MFLYICFLLAKTNINIIAQSEGGASLVKTSVAQTKTSQQTGAGLGGGNTYLLILALTSFLPAWLQFLKKSEINGVD